MKKLIKNLFNQETKAMFFFCNACSLNTLMNPLRKYYFDYLNITHVYNKKYEEVTLGYVFHS